MSLYEQSICTNAAMSEAEQALFERYSAQLPAMAKGFLATPPKQLAPLMRLPDNQQLEAIIALAQQIRGHASELIVIGTGGSSLGGKTLCALSDERFAVHFLENLDPHSMQHLLTPERLRRSHLLMISKSGGTMETICQSLIVLEAMQKELGSDAIKSRAHGLSMPGDSALRQLCAHYDIPMIDHHPHIGGRFSVLSNVGLLPAACAGVDIAALLQGAQNVLASLHEPACCAPLIGAAWQCALMNSRPVSVLMPYCDRLAMFGNWYRQLWAESLGKDGQGSTPVRALGAVDQHSQLQLYLDGPKDKSFTLLLLDNAQQGALIPKAPMEGFDYLAGKTAGRVMQALQEGTAQTLERHDLPLRRMHLPRLDEAALGALLMHFMLETVASAGLIDVNAFDQPAVEESKQLARAALCGKAVEAA